MSNVNEATRDRFGEVLQELAARDRNVVALDCDLGRSTRSYKITEVDSERFFDIGISEQDMISTAAGMAREGKIVFANTFAVFLCNRAFDQIRQQVALPKLNVKLCGSSAGITQGPDGATHQALLDIALMRILPNMIVTSPADGNQLKHILEALYLIPGPAYIRLSRYATGAFLPEDTGFALGKAHVIQEGKDVVIIGHGPVFKHAIEAGEILKQRGINPGIINYHTIKPMDEASVIKICAIYKYVVCVEEHNIIGGLASVFAETVMRTQGAKCIPHMLAIGIEDRFGESGTALELLQYFGLDAESIAEKIIRFYTNIQEKQ